MNNPAASCEVSNTMKTLLEQSKLITVYYLILLPLVFDIVSYCFFIAISTNRVDVVSTRPEFSAPEYFLNFRMSQKYFSTRDALDYLNNIFRPHHRHTLYQKMHMIFINSYFYKMYLVPFSYSYTSFFQTLRDSFRKYFTSVFCRTYNVV